MAKLNQTLPKHNSMIESGLNVLTDMASAIMQKTSYQHNTEIDKIVRRAMCDIWQIV